MFRTYYEDFAFVGDDGDDDGGGDDDDDDDDDDAVWLRRVQDYVGDRVHFRRETVVRHVFLLLFLVLFLLHRGSYVL